MESTILISEVIKNKFVDKSHQKPFYHQYALLNVPTYIEFMNILEQQGEYNFVRLENNCY